MNRSMVYVGAVPMDVDWLQPQQDAMVALGHLAETVLGRDPVVDALQVVATVPTSMGVRVQPGQIYQLAALEPNPYGSLPADASHQIVKQGSLLDPVNLPVTAPATSGYQQYFLIQCAFQERDGGQVVLPFYNAANPAQQWSGPNNSGEAQYTRRFGTVLCQVKAGAPAPAGSAAKPTPDPGWVGLAHVLTANGQTSVASQHVTPYPSVPRLPVKLPLIARAAGLSLTTISTSTTLTADQSGLVVVDVAAFSGQITARLPAANANGGLPMRFTFVGSRALKPGANPQATSARILASGTDGITGGGVTVYPMDHAVLVSDGISRWHLVSHAPQDNMGWQTVGTQAIPTAVDTAINWASRTHESPISFNLGSPDLSAIVCAVPVLRCRISGGAYFVANGTGGRQAYFTLNGGALLGTARVGAASTGHTAVNCSAGPVLALNQGDTVKMWVNQDSGGALNMTGAWIQIEVLD